MPQLMIVIFVALFASVLAAVGVGAKLLEAQRKKKVSAVLATVSAGAQVPQAKVLVEQVNLNQLSLAQFLARFNFAQKLETHMHQAGLEWTISRLLLTIAGGAVCGALIGLKLRVLFFPSLSMLVLAAIAGAMPLFYVGRKRKKRLGEFEKQFPEALDFLARAMKAGHAFPVSIEMLATETPEPLQTEFHKLFNEQNLGAPLSDALKHLAARIPLIDVRFFVSAVLMQRETGGNLGEILTKLSRVIRERFQLKGQVKSASAHGRITSVVLTVLPMLTAFAIISISPEHMLLMARDPHGKIMIITAVFLQGLGYYLMRKIVNIKV